MKAFVPPVVGGNIEVGNRRSHVLHLSDFFFQREAGDEVVDALIDRERGIEVWGRRLGQGESRQKHYGKEKQNERFHGQIVAQ